MFLRDKNLTDGAGGGLAKSKKKQKRENAWKPEGPKDPFAMVSLDSLPEKKQQEIQKALHLFSLGSSLPKTLQQAKKHTYRFWDTQPVPKLGDVITSHGPIEERGTCIQSEPYLLPQGFSWDTLDLSNTSVLRELCHLLNENYMEEDDNTIRSDFSPEYLLWTLQPPNWLLQWHLGVRVDSNKKLVGFIAAVPADVKIYEIKKQLVQVKFLCVHKKLRLKRMTPVLIRELTRRVNQQGLFQAVYAAGTLLHMTDSHKKLMEVNYPGLKQSMNLQRAIRLNHLPEVTKIKGLRPMTKEDSSGIHLLLEKNFNNFHLSPLLSPQEIEHWFLPKENVNDTYVVEADDGTLTDMVSFYTVCSRVLNHPIHTNLKAAFLFYAACNATGMDELMQDILIRAKSKGFDIFCALDVMDNLSFLEKLKFTLSDKSLHYYLYNWMCPPMSPNKVLTVLKNSSCIEALFVFQCMLKFSELGSSWNFF
uniref:Glycylpeptide N-tetradecanoyltransferase n=1 Tax=Cyprinodon variegatus TaxID=28743 RepID=A0A3Q2DH98_CYPVA